MPVPKPAIAYDIDPQPPTAKTPKRLERQMEDLGTKRRYTDFTHAVELTHHHDSLSRDDLTTKLEEAAGRKKAPTPILISY
jgi:hypothetical protein